MEEIQRNAMKQIDISWWQWNAENQIQKQNGVIIKTKINFTNKTAVLTCPPPCLPTFTNMTVTFVDQWPLQRQ